ncbi:MAG TPA: hypothetical protein VFK20_06960 [Vicinamibacterales bacterium]|nr:hypothetical protein [Vicinamibacterales bacterium]
MLVYREDARPVELVDELRRLRASVDDLEASPGIDAALTLLIEIGELEAAVADALAPERDALSPAASLLRTATLDAARIWLAARDGVPHAGTPADVAQPLEALITMDMNALPRRVSLRVSEGFAYYALFPDTYVASARAFADEQRPRSVVCIGLRSIGTSLSAVAAVSLAAQGIPVTSYTVRPRGHPFDRQIVLRDDLAALWQHAAADGAMFLVIDEGPGLSGSSIASSVLHLEQLGVPRERIAILPGADPPAERLRSPAAQDVWRTHRRYIADPAALGLTPQRAFGVREAIDFSAGRWRRHLYGSEAQWPAVQPQHERWKVFVPATDTLLKFVGLGPYGRAAADRAARLHAHGLGPRPDALRNGFLALDYVPGAPLGTGEANVADAGAIGRYIAQVADVFPAPRNPPASVLLHMIETNAGEALGCAASAVRAAVGHLAPLVDDTPGAATDGRMLAHEWVRTTHGLAKVDGLDHHRDHFFPGSQDAAWDLAAAIIELPAGDRERAALVSACRRASGDRTIERRLPFFIAACAAFRLGYCRMAAVAIAGSDDERRFVREAQRYARTLTEALHLPAALPSAP